MSDAVQLEADASPYMETFDALQEYTKSWATGIESSFARIGTKARGIFGSIKSSFLSATQTFLAEGPSALQSVMDKGQELQTSLQGFLQLDSGAMGSKIGGDLLGAIGHYFGGSSGEAWAQQIGSWLGTSIGEAFNLNGLANKVSSTFASMDTSGITSWLDVLRNDVLDTTGKIADSFNEISAKDVFDWLIKDSEEAGAKIVGIWDSITSEISGFFLRGLDRIREAIDSVWGVIQEPIAVVADWLQAVAVKLGLVEASTQSWGDAIRSIADVGKQVVEALAYGIGYLEGLFKQFYGYVLEYVIVPLSGYWSKLLGFMSDSMYLLKGCAVVGEAFEKASKALEKVSNGIKSSQKGMLEDAKKLQNMSAADQAEMRRSQVGEMLKEGARQREERDRKTEAVVDVPPPEPPKSSEPAALASVQAMVAGSRDANNAILRAMGQAQQSAADRAAAAAEASVEKQEEVAVGIQTMTDTTSAKLAEVVDELAAINKQLEDAEIVKSL